MLNRIFLLYQMVASFYRYQVFAVVYLFVLRHLTANFSWTGLKSKAEPTQYNFDSLTFLNKINMWNSHEISTKKVFQVWLVWIQVPCELWNCWCYPLIMSGQKEPFYRWRICENYHACVVCTVAGIKVCWIITIHVVEQTEAWKDNHHSLRIFL